MNILFLADSYQKNHEILIESIIRCFQLSNHNVDMEIVPDKYYNCIFILNKKKIKVVKQNPSLKGVPVIFAFCVSDTSNEYTFDLNLFDHTIIFEDKTSSIPLSSFINNSFMNMIYVADYNVDNVFVDEISDRPAIYVNIDNNFLGETVFLKVLPIFNQLSKYDFYCYCTNKNYRPLLNKHIKILDDRHNPMEYIQKSEMVIGSGYSAIMGLLESKKTIVVGERGFGGIVNDENLGSHFSNFFQGRNGGKYDEYIPLDLLKRSIEDIGTPSLSKSIMEHLDSNNCNLISVIERVVSTCEMLNNNLKDIPLILKNEYLLMHYNNHYWIVNHLFGTFHKRINESECAILSMFSKGCTPQMILNEYPEYESEVMEFINELINMKVLTRFYGNDNMISRSRHIID